MVGKQIKTIGWHGSRKHSFMKRPLIQEIISKILKEARKYIKVKYINFNKMLKVNASNGYHFTN